MVVLLGKIIVEEVIDRSNRVKVDLPLNTTYGHYRIASILYKFDIYDLFMGQYGQISSFPKNLSQLM
jgi:hypothetical protein